MKPLFPFALLVLSMAGCQSQPVVETKPAPPAAAVTNSATKTLLAGQYAGKWTSTEGTAGNIRITLKREGAAAWGAEAMFTYEGVEIPGKVKSVQAQGATIRIVFDWEIQGTAGQSTISGEASGDTLAGTYETKGIAGASRGTWSATRS